MDSDLSSAGPPHPIREEDILQLLKRHDQLSSLCDKLEACADRLPTWPTEDEAERLCATLGTVVEREAERDDGLAAGMLGYQSPDRLAAALLRHVGSRHADDVIHAQDLIAVLRAGPAAGGKISAETLGYMLRCFFAARRQAIVFEELAVFALNGERLAPASRSLLLDHLCRRAA